MSPPNFVELIGLRRPEGQQGGYATLHPPEPYGHVSHDAAYGGCVQASSIVAAFDLLDRRQAPPGTSSSAAAASTTPLRLYSLHGTYLGPTLAGVHLRLSAQVLRSTKSFFTVHVRTYQTQREQERITFVATIDFMATGPEQQREEEGFQRVSALPLLQPVPRLEDAESLDEIAEERIRRGVLLREVWQDMYEDLFLLSKRTGETKEVPGTAHHATLHGCTTDVENPQRHKHITKRCIADWNRARGSLAGLCESAKQSRKEDEVVISPLAASCAYFAFYLDAGLPYVPLITSGLSLADTSHATSLEVVVRFADPEPKADEWHYKEITSIAQRNERTTSQAHSWDQQGNLTVHATQVGLIRPVPKL